MFCTLNSVRFCCDVWMVLQGNLVMFNNLLLGPPDEWQRVSVVVVFVQSLRYRFITSMLGLASFPQHVLGLVHSLPFRWCMFGTANGVLFLTVYPGIVKTSRRSCSCPPPQVFAKIFNIFHQYNGQCRSPSIMHNRSIAFWKRSRKARRSPYCSYRRSTSATFRWIH